MPFINNIVQVLVRDLKIIINALVLAGSFALVIVDSDQFVCFVTPSFVFQSQRTGWWVPCGISIRSHHFTLSLLRSSSWLAHLRSGPTDMSPSHQPLNTSLLLSQGFHNSVSDDLDLLL